MKKSDLFGAQIFDETRRTIVSLKECVINLDTFHEQIREKFNLPFKIRTVLSNHIFVANLQIGDEIKFLNENPLKCREHEFFLPAEVNGGKCLVRWGDLHWYVELYSNEKSFPTCEVLESIFPRHGHWFNTEYLYNNKFKVSGFCDVDAYVFHSDGRLKYTKAVVDDKVEVRIATKRLQKPLYIVI